MSTFHDLYDSYVRTVCLADRRSAFSAFPASALRGPENEVNFVKLLYQQEFTGLGFRGQDSWPMP